MKRTPHQPPLYDRFARHLLILISIAFMLAVSALVLAYNLSNHLEMPMLADGGATAPDGQTLWSVGKHEGEQYREYVGIYPNSTLWNETGSPSLRFTDYAPSNPEHPRDFEIGFYRYGPTWYSRHYIVEFWLGGGNGGILSVAGNDRGGGELQVRNPADTDSIQLSFFDAKRPVIQTETGAPLYLSAQEGLVSENTHTFQEGIHLDPKTGYAGQMMHPYWTEGELVVHTHAVNETSLILLTPLSRPRGQWWVGSIQPGESFRVFSTASDEDMSFNWAIIQAHGSNGFNEEANSEHDE